MNSTTCTNKNIKTLTLSDIQEAKRLILRNDADEVKQLGIKAADLKFNHPEFYRGLDDGDKFLIDNAIKQATFIIKEERATTLTIKLT